MTTTSESRTRLTSIDIAALNGVVGGDTWVTQGGQVIVDGRLKGELDQRHRQGNNLVYSFGSPIGKLTTDQWGRRVFTSQ